MAHETSPTVSPWARISKEINTNTVLIAISFAVLYWLGKEFVTRTEYNKDQFRLEQTFIKFDASVNKIEASQTRLTEILIQDRARQPLTK